MKKINYKILLLVALIVIIAIIGFKLLVNTNNSTSNISPSTNAQTEISHE
jgi:beta-lactamase regulating signal transducer with metallopeptidase domain